MVVFRFFSVYHGGYHDMRYLGGKEKVADKVVGFLQPHVDAATAYYEPFVGGASILCRVAHPFRFASDANPHLPVLYRALVGGWNPPEHVARIEHTYYKAIQPLGDPTTAFIGFGCCFGGDWYAGYAGVDERTGRTYAGAARRGLLKKLPGLKGATFDAAHYWSVRPLPGAVVYCDPPYHGTTGYGAVGRFDSDAFWQWARTTSRHSKVFVSEYSAPDDFKCVWSMERNLEIQSAKKGQKRIEKIFTYAGE